MVPFALMAVCTFFIVRGDGATYDETVFSGRFHLHVSGGNQITRRKLGDSGHHWAPLTCLLEPADWGREMRGNFAYKMLLALGMNWSTGVLLGGGPVCAPRVLRRCPVSPVFIHLSYTQQRTLRLSIQALKELRFFRVGSSPCFSVGAVISIPWSAFCRNSLSHPDENPRQAGERDALGLRWLSQLLLLPAWDSPGDEERVRSQPSPRGRSCQFPNFERRWPSQ